MCIRQLPLTQSSTTGRTCPRDTQNMIVECKKFEFNFNRTKWRRHALAIVMRRTLVLERIRSTEDKFHRSRNRLYSAPGAKDIHNRGNINAFHRYNFMNIFGQ